MNGWDSARIGSSLPLLTQGGTGDIVVAAGVIAVAIVLVILFVAVVLLRAEQERRRWQQEMRQIHERAKTPPT